MRNLPLDRKATNLLERVRKDICHLRDDMSDLWSHTTRKSLPRAARGLGDLASNRLAAGGAYAAGRLRRSVHRHTPARHHTGGWLTGALAVGLVAAGVYAFVKNSEHSSNGGSTAGGPDDMEDQFNSLPG